MSKVGIADLKARLSEHLRKVRSGRVLTVVDRDTPVATIAPYESPAGNLDIRAATRRPRDLEIPPPPARRTDSLAALLRDRATR